MRSIHSSKTAMYLCALIITATLLFSPGCSTVLVQPYDQKLIDETDVIFKKAATMIDTGISVSPLTDEDRRSIKNPTDNAAHLSKFENIYLELNTDADALILRALAKSQVVDAFGEMIQEQITELIEKELPSQCDELESELATSTPSLTVKNYVDLKCILLRWRTQHEDAQVTQKTQILKKINWELRKRTLFDAILAIQRAELSKQPK